MMPSVRPSISLPIDGGLKVPAALARDVAPARGSRLASASMSKSAVEAVEWLRRQRRIEDGDVVVRAGRQIDLVVASPRAANDDEVAGPAANVARLDPGPQHDQAVEVAEVLGPSRPSSRSRYQYDGSSGSGAWSVRK